MIGILSLSEIESILTRNRLGRLAMCVESRPYVVPVWFRYDGQAIFSYSGAGQKIAIMRIQPNVALLVEEINSENSWKSVIVEGLYQELSDPAERQHAFAALSSNGSSSMPRDLSLESGLIFYRIVPDSRSGRFETSES